MTELPLDLAPPTERARPRGLQQTWLAAPGAHAAALAAPLRLSPHAQCFPVFDPNRESSCVDKGTPRAPTKPNNAEAG
jgi:hypothetical protein